MADKNTTLNVTNKKSSSLALAVLGAGNLSGTPISCDATPEMQGGNPIQKIMRDIKELRSKPSPSSLTAVKHRIKRIENKASLEYQLFDARAAVKILTSQIAMHLDTEWRKELFNQIDLLHDPEEWDLDDAPINNLSFKAFLKGFLQINPTRHPGLGLSYEGNIIAAWTTGKDRLTIEFLPIQSSRWVLTRYHNEQPERFAGQIRISRLSNSLAPYHPEHWLS